jgi:cellulose biosynthesis protein BcsQ
MLAPGPDSPPRLGERLALLPAGPALARAALTWLLAGGREQALSEALRPVSADDEVTLLDCPPALGLLTLAALVAADEVLIPADPDGPDAHELEPLLAALDRLRAGGRAPRLTTIGVVATPGSGKAKALLAVLDHLSPRPDSPPALLGELLLADAAARGRRPSPPGCGRPHPAPRPPQDSHRRGSEPDLNRTRPGR